MKEALPGHVGRDGSLWIYDQLYSHRKIGISEYGEEGSILLHIKYSRKRNHPCGFQTAIGAAI